MLEKESLLKYFFNIRTLSDLSENLRKIVQNGYFTDSQNRFLHYLKDCEITRVDIETECHSECRIHLSIWYKNGNLKGKERLYCPKMFESKEECMLYLEMTDQMTDDLRERFKKWN